MPAADRIRARRQQGLALVSVLWIVSLLAVLATGVTAATRDETRLVTALLAQADARYAAEGALQLAVHELLYPDADPWPTDGTEREVSVGVTTVRVTVTDEAGKIDLNLVQPDLLGSLLAAAGVAEDRRDELVDAILDWRDEDDLRRLHGAEDDEYAQAGLRHGAKDGTFGDVAELRLVLGMEPQIYAALRPALTVYSHHAGVNPTFAPRLVLLALANGNAAAVDAYLELRTAERDSRLDMPRPTFAERRLVTSARGQTYTIVAQAERADGVVGRVQATVALERGSLEQPVRMLAWRADPAPATGSSEVDD